ncbi:hypothetical protein [Undibacterium sp. YM2]|uniref:hypothetical protein n=1 Tax=Undibacterium sp. YM2 TaxID=2058625 RepID=UPI0013893F06|nr:hypothetical protein [Undibacterium sp. YM2]
MLRTYCALQRNLLTDSHFMQVLGTIIFLMAACFSWWLAFQFSSIAGVYGALIFLAPILLMIVPIAVRAFKTKSATLGAFLLAIAPVLGALNFLPWVIFCEIGELLLGKNADNVVIFAQVFTVLPWIFVACSILIPTKKSGQI